MQLMKRFVFASGMALAALTVSAARFNEPMRMTPAQHRFDAPMRYMFKEAKTTLATMGKFIEATNDAFEENEKAGKIHAEGPAVFIYDGADGNPDTEFTLKIGTEVSADQKPVDGFKIADLPKYESVSSVYCGPMSSIKDAYGQLFGELMQQGFEPTGIGRETYLHWEGMDSENNITLISVEVKSKV